VGCASRGLGLGPRCVGLWSRSLEAVARKSLRGWSGLEWVRLGNLLLRVVRRSRVIFDKGWSRAETGSAVVLDSRKMWDILRAALAYI
jgi:hypothetical protein